jgi:hypothetical protein
MSPRLIKSLVFKFVVFVYNDLYKTMCFGGLHPEWEKKSDLCQLSRGGATYELNFLIKD